MKKRLTQILTLTGVTAAMAFGGVGIAQASNGADDPPGTHQEHRGKEHRGKRDDRAGHHRRGDRRDDRGRHGGRHNDDGPNHR
jgi:hypothetical protein